MLLHAVEVINKIEIKKHYAHVQRVFHSTETNLYEKVFLQSVSSKYIYLSNKLYKNSLFSFPFSFLFLISVRLARNLQHRDCFYRAMSTFFLTAIFHRIRQGFCVLWLCARTPLFLQRFGHT